LLRQITDNEREKEIIMQRKQERKDRGSMSDSERKSMNHPDTSGMGKGSASSTNRASNSRAGGDGNRVNNPNRSGDSSQSTSSGSARTSSPHKFRGSVGGESEESSQRSTSGGSSSGSRSRGMSE